MNIIIRSPTAIRTNTQLRTHCEKYHIDLGVVIGVYHVNNSKDLVLTIFYLSLFIISLKYK